MKKSNIILSITFIAILSSSVLFAFRIKNHATPAPPIKLSSFLVGKGEVFSDTILGSFHVLKSNFPALVLDARYADQLIFEGFSNARDYISYQIKNDTLFIIAKNTDTEYEISADKVNTEYTLRAHVGANNLKGLLLFGEGEVRHDATALGVKLDGTMAYKDGHLKRYQLQLDDFEISLRDKSKASIFLNANHINIDFKRHTLSSNTSVLFRSPPNFNTLSFLGKANKLHVHDPQGSVKNFAGGLELDTLIVHELESTEKINGSISANPRKLIDVKLYHNMDVSHDGLVVKTNVITTGYGRLINTNKAYKDRKKRERGE